LKLEGFDVEQARGGRDCGAVVDDPEERARMMMMMMAKMIKDIRDRGSRAFMDFSIVNVGLLRFATSRMGFSAIVL
jgi:hypothetical protein